MLDIDESAWIPRKDDREPWDQIHGFYRVEKQGDTFIKIPDPHGNVKMTVRVGDVIEFLSNYSDDTPIVVDLNADGPENADCAIFEAMTAFDDPDPYTCIVVRSTNG